MLSTVCTPFNVSFEESTVIVDGTLIFNEEPADKLLAITVWNEYKAAYLVLKLSGVTVVLVKTPGYALNDTVLLSIIKNS